MSYQQFIENKIISTTNEGFEVSDDDLHPSNLPHQRDIIKWAAKGGKRAIFASFGLGKTQIQLELARLCLQHLNAGDVVPMDNKALIVCPLGVKQEFKNDAERLGIKVKYCRSMAEVKAATESIIITNYERVRDGDINPDYFHFASLDEASVLRSYGSKTYQEFLPLFLKVPYRFVCTATPSPNKYKELIHYAGFLGIMDTGQALTRWFKRDSTKANNLTLYEHKEREFWLWVASWGIFITRPSDLGYSDEGYDLPPLLVHWHLVSEQAKEAIIDRDGQSLMFKQQAADLSTSAREKRDSLEERVSKAFEIVQQNSPEKHWVLWHDLESERDAIEKKFKGLDIRTVYGSQEEQVKEDLLIGFARGQYKILATKASIAGQGCNFQYHCSDAIFVGIDYKFNDFIQAIHRIQRFQQPNPCNIHIIYTDAEEHIRKELEAKWSRHYELVDNMTSIIKEFGLNHASAIGELKRSIGISRREVKGDRFTYVNNDSVIEWQRLEDNRFGMILTSIPFSNHYEYTPSYNDFGHTNNDDHFFSQMDYLTPNLLRTLKPGRVCAVHVKDRILFGNVTGYGMPSVNPFHAKTIFHFIKHGFIFFGQITIETDVVRENNQTYRLGWTEKCKDGSKMGVGSPEYLLLFRKLPTDTSRAYADEPVKKHKGDRLYTCSNCGFETEDFNKFEVLEEDEIIERFGWDYYDAGGPSTICPSCKGPAVINETLVNGYTRGHWQIDARAKWNSSGNSLLTPEEIRRLGVDVLSNKFSSHFAEHIYSYEQHVVTADALDREGKLPATFEMLKVPARTDYVWDDIVRMRTLNSRQTQSKEQNHICPFQLDIVDRAIELWSNEGDEIADCFGGIGSVGVEAIEMNRKAFLCELNAEYFQYGTGYCKEAEYKQKVPTLFDVIF